MKALRFIIIVMMFVWPAAAISQCVSPLQSITYDTTVTGGGNSVYNFSFPKFSAPSGTLVEVRIRSEVTLSYAFELENTGAAPVSGYRVRVDRNDQVTSDALLDPIDTTFPRKTYGPLSLSASDGVPGSGSDYYYQPENYILNHAAIQRTVYNTADYLGVGNVDFEYTSNSFTISPTSPPTYATANDTITFSITYIICPTWFLASDISFFSAKKRDDMSVDVSWITYNETDDRKYIIESSSDGRNFRYVEEVRAFPKHNQTGNYYYLYKARPGETGKIVFRLKQVERNGSVTYSPLRMVELTKRTDHKVKIYPNPGNGQINILFHNQKRSDWKVEIFSVNGQLLQQYNFTNTLLAKMDLRGRLPKGTYILKTIQKRSQGQSIQKIIID